MGKGERRRGRARRHRAHHRHHARAAAARRRRRHHRRAVMTHNSCGTTNTVSVFTASTQSASRRKVFVIYVGLFSVFLLITGGSLLGIGLPDNTGLIIAGVVVLGLATFCLVACCFMGRYCQTLDDDGVEPEAGSSTDISNTHAQGNREGALGMYTTTIIDETGARVTFNMPQHRNPNMNTDPDDIAVEYPHQPPPYPTEDLQHGEPQVPPPPSYEEVVASRSPPTFASDATTEGTTVDPETVDTSGE